MSGGGTYLHHSHRSQDGSALRALRWNAAPDSRAERLEALTARAGGAVADGCEGGGEGQSEGSEGRGEDKACNAIEVLRTQRSLVLQSPGAEDVRVPMLLAEVAYSSAEDAAVVAIARPAEGEAEEDSVYDVWLFVPTGGQVGLHSFLNLLSDGGAVCGDLSAHFDVGYKPFASGGCACVHKVRALQAPGEGKECATLAAKVLPAGDRREVARADSEAGLLFRAQGHPNVARLHGVFFCADWPGEDGEGKEKKLPRSRQVLLLDLCAEGCLHSRVRHIRPYTEAEALDTIAALLAALAHIHRRGIVHRDVKAENVLVGADEKPILSDFGIAALVSDASAMQDRCGTHGYAAPEMLKVGAPYGKKVDVFGAGAVLYFCIVARSPFSSPSKDKQEVTRNTIKGGVDFPADLGISAAARRFILLLLAKDPDDRPSATGALSVVDILHHARSPYEPSEDEGEATDENCSVSKRSLASSATAARDRSPGSPKSPKAGRAERYTEPARVASGASLRGSLTPLVPGSPQNRGKGLYLSERPEEKYSVAKTSSPRRLWTKQTSGGRGTAVERTTPKPQVAGVRGGGGGTVAVMVSDASSQESPSSPRRTRARRLSEDSWASPRMGSKGSSVSGVATWGVFNSQGWFHRSRKASSPGGARPAEPSATNSPARPSSPMKDRVSSFFKRRTASTSAPSA